MFFMSEAYRLGIHFSVNFVDELNRQVIFFSVGNNAFSSTV